MIRLANRPYTLLKLTDYARVIGINPAHFFGGYFPNIDPQTMPVRASCDSIWKEYQWQSSDSISRSEIAALIHDAEVEIAQYLGYWPAPMWISDEVISTRRKIIDEYSSILLKTEFGKIINTGRRSIRVIAVHEIDPNNDFEGDDVAKDRIRIDFDLTASLGITSFDDAIELCETIHLYQYRDPADVDSRMYSFDRRNEIVPLSVKLIDVAGNIHVIFLVDVYQCVRMELYEANTTDYGEIALDFGDTGNFIEKIAIVSETVSTSEAHAAIYYNDGGYPDAGIVEIIDPELGLIRVRPAEWSNSEGKYVEKCWRAGYYPKYVKVWYQSGYIARDYIERDTYFYSDVESYTLASPSMVETNMAIAISYLATARAKRSFCNCSVSRLVEKLQENMMTSTRERTNYATKFIMNCPFGTAYGEVEAFRLINNAAARIPRVAVI